MRSRNIKPSFFKNENLADIEPHARLLFIGLWCIADREGRFEDRPKRIRAEIFPYECVDVEELMRKLEEAGFLVRYEFEGERYAEILNFTRHQYPHIKEAESTIPAPTSTQTQPEQEQCEHGAISPESPILNPESLILNTPKSPSRVADGFQEFYSAYPKKKGKQDALKAWKKIKQSEVPEIMAALKRQTRAPDWIRDGGQYIPYPASWLNGRRWEDEEDPPPNVGDNDPFGFSTIKVV